MKKFSFWTRILLLLCFIVFCSSNGWAWNRVYLIGSLTGNNWDSNRTSHAFTDSSEDGKSYYEVSVTPGHTYYFAVYIDHYKHRCGPNTPNADIKQNDKVSDEDYHRANNYYNSWKIIPTTNKIRICSDQKDNHDETPWIWVEEVGTFETTYPINITNGTGGTVSPSGSQKVGATGINVTATPNIGYKFKNWIATGGASVGTSATTRLTASAAGSLKANFEEVTPLTIYLQNDANWATPITAYVYNEESGSTTIKNADWPGEEMVSLGSGRFSYTITNEALFNGRVIFVGRENRYPADGQQGLAIENKSKVFNTSGTTWDLAGPTVTFTPAAGSYTDAMSLKVTLSGEADSKTYTCIVTKGDVQVASKSFQMSSATVTETVYYANSDGLYAVTVKDGDNVLATATYTIAIEEKYVVKVSAGVNGNVSPSGDINVGETPVAISANAAPGYQFKQWTTTGGVTVTNASANTTITANSEGTVKAIFEEYTVPDMSYYLVGNFFDDDPADEIDYGRRYFKFNIQKDGRYMVEIPAAVTAKAQILGVEGSTTIKYGPNCETYNIHGSHPETDLSATGKFASSSTNNYWNLTTRNDGTYDDDGLYEVSFTLNDAGEPDDWTWKHVSTKRVAYFLSDADGATANPVYNSRNEVDAAFSNKTYAMVHIDPNQSYYTIGYVLRDKESDYINKATAYGAHVNQRNESILPTTNKLFLMGNNGRTFKAQNPYNEVSPHVAAIKVDDKQAGLYKVEYNPSNGNNEWAKGTHNEQPDNEKNTVGIRGQIIFLGGDMGGTGYDSPISSISMVGNAIPGTTNGDGTWNWASTAGDMTYDENEGCYKLTIQTTASENTANQFRFVANHTQAMTWYEDGTTDAKKARVPYLEDGDGHSCMPTDPNPVAYTVTDNTDDTDVNIIFNRPAGTWTVRFYIDINEQGQKSYRYTITGKESFDIPLTYCYNKFIRTYSNDIAMDLTDDVKAYIAYKFEQPQNPKDNYAACKVYLRQMDYIPANVGVVLVGKVPDGHSYSEGDPLNFSLQKRVDAVPEDLRYVWTKHDTYIGAGNLWHNFLVHTVDAVNNLGNAEANNDGKIINRYFGLNNYHSTAYYKSTHSGADYIGFFRLTKNGKSGANKAYLSIPSSENTEVTEYYKENYGVLDFNAQLSGQVTDENNTSLAKAMLFFDDEDIDDNTSTGITTIKDNIVKDNVYYNMQGIRVVNPTKGIYIFNGKKILVK